MPPAHDKRYLERPALLEVLARPIGALRGEQRAGTAHGGAMGHGSALVGGVLLLGGLLWLWYWVWRQTPTLMRGWARARSRPRVATLRRRARPLGRFVRARLSPEGYLGLHLTLGALILISASGLFGLIVEDVMTNAPLTVLDRQVAAWLHARATPPVTTVMLAISFFGSLRWVAAVVLGTALLLGWHRRWDVLLALVLTVPGGMGLNVLLKSAFQRGRPTFVDPLLVLVTYSFPSGHAMAATCLYGVLAAVAAWRIRAWRVRMVVGGGAGLVIVLVGFSRLYLGVHYLSDVLGGMAAGVAWLAICLTGVETVRRHRLVSRR